MRVLSRVARLSRNVVTPTLHQVRNGSSIIQDPQARQAFVDRLKGRFGTLKYLGQTPEIHNYNNLIYRCTTAGHSDQAKYFYEALIAQNLVPDLETFALVLGACLYDNNALRASSFLQDMSVHGVLPTKPFFDTAASIFKNSGHKTQAAAFEELAKKPKVTQEEFDAALSKLGDLAKGEK